MGKMEATADDSKPFPTPWIMQIQGTVAILIRSLQSKVQMEDSADDTLYDTRTAGLQCSNAKKENDGSLSNRNERKFQMERDEVD